MPPSKTVYGTQMETQDRRKIKKIFFGKREKACVKILLVEYSLCDWEMSFVTYYMVYHAKTK